MKIMSVVLPLFRRCRNVMITSVIAIICIVTSDLENIEIVINVD